MRLGASQAAYLLRGVGVVMNEAFHIWKAEQLAIEAEMNELMMAGPTTSADERQVRRIRFMALVERREAAARALLASDRDHFRRRKSAFRSVESESDLLLKQ
jgi:hypothetical protein